MTTRLRGAVALLALAVAAAGCGTTDTEEAAESATRTVETVQGPVTVPAEPQRIVVVNGALAGFLFDLDTKVAAADPRILGVTLQPGEFPAAWAADAKAQGTVAVPSGDDMNFEFIAAQQPDLIIGGGPGFPGLQSIKNYDMLSDIAPTALVPSDATSWQDQLRSVAEIVNRTDKVDGMLATYDAKVAEVKAALKPPQGAAAVLQSHSNNEPLLIAPDTSLFNLLASVGISMDTDIERKAGFPERPAAGDWVNFSPELLSTVVDAPVLFVVVNAGGRTIEQLKQDPLHAALPAFQAGNLFELPPISYRPDYRSAMATLDLLAEMFQ